LRDGWELPRVGDVINEKYRIERVLGTGGMSAVFEATHCLTDRSFALKWLRPDMATREDVVRRFVREARVAGRFKHPNVVEVYDFGQAGGSFYIVMELLEGESLEERLERVGRLSPDEARRVLLPCMRGVARAHAAGVIHRDIKTANIFLCAATEERPELPKVLDFGISRFTTPDVVRDSPVTESGVWMGTPQYMSPEQVRGKRADHRTDVYGFGVVLYELLSGVVAFDAVTTSDLMVKIATEEPRPLRELVPGIDPALVEITKRAMARKPEDRYQDLDSMIRALQPGSALPGARAATRGAAPELDGTATSAGGKRRFLALAAAALLGLLAVSWLLGQERRDPPASSATPEPRELAKADASAAKARASAGTTAGDAAKEIAPAAKKSPAERSARRTQPRDTARRPRGKPPNARGESGVTFDLDDFLPNGSAKGAKPREPGQARSEL
jgi:serine/threonine-protein kinase